MKIGVLTGGGDVPGLNPCIKAVVTQAEEYGWEVVGFRRGWAGPLEFNLDDPETSAANCLMPLDRQKVRTIGRSGGTILHSSRTNPAKVKPDALPAFLESEYGGGDIADCTPHVLKVMEHLGVDALVPIGGDDTLSYAARLHQEGYAVNACPKTMDNDVFGTDYCIGFSTAVSRSVEAIDALRTPTGSHERIAVIELFGRNSGETALISGFLADADRVGISEVPLNMDKLAEQLMADREKNPSHYAMFVVSEGAMLEGGDVIETGEADAYGHRKLGGIGQIIGEELKQRTGIGIIGQSLAYMMRAGAPDALDRMVGTAYGTMAVQLLKRGVNGRMMAIHDGNYTHVDGDLCIQGVRRVDVDELYDTANYRPKLRNVDTKPMFMY